MKRHEYRAITTGVGETIRNAYTVATRPGAARSDILAALSAGGITDETLRARVLEQAVALAGRVGGQSDRGRLQTADALTLTTLREIRGADALDGDKRLPGEQREEEDREQERAIAASLAHADRINDPQEVEFEDERGRRWKGSI